MNTPEGRLRLRAHELASALQLPPPPAPNPAAADFLAQLSSDADRRGIDQLTSGAGQAELSEVRGTRESS